MKLYKFAAPDSKNAILTVKNTLGDDALIYSMRNIHHGVEVVAGYETSSLEEDSHVHSVDNNVSLHLQSLEENIQKLSDSVSHLYQYIMENTRKAQEKKWPMNLLPAWFRIKSSNSDKQVSSQEKKSVTDGIPYHQPRKLRCNFKFVDNNY